MPLIGAILALLAGSALLALAVHMRLGWHWSGRTWATRPWDTSTNVLLTLPGGGLFLIAAGLLHWFPSSVASILMMVVLPLSLVLLLWGGFFTVPMWLVPSWARDGVAKARRRLKGAKR